MAWLGIAAFAAALVALVLGGCDRRRIEALEEGVATEADVRKQFGVPAAVYREPDGSTTLEYTRQPEGRQNYMITIGTDGRMSALRQVLKPVDFARVVAGLDKTQVRRLLGQPASARHFALKHEEVWDWRYVEGNENRIFSVTFDAAGRVVSTASTLDLQGVVPGGK
ncbi:MAG: outer membrane protein assembly factor BamE [Burkholderiaceae bacterium]